MTLQKHPAISVAATADTFRRVGHVFGRMPQTLALAALSPEAYRAITDDPSLVVVPTAVEMDATQAKALPYRDAEHVVDALASVESLTLDVGHEDKRRILELDERQAELDRQAKALDARRVELDAREQSLDGREQSIAGREKKVAADAGGAKKAAKADAPGK
ncbi:hypothetical protein [Pandoraea apista]|uniref:hypothetical protein n=1 Tax=Pandoraea apista TaxID=93218 RepID=UPI000F65E1BB|nr:hypothetical protein [Pandoraea apista]RRW89152.1 hypothetical protein EGJ54_23635 [Pandoraea apista]RRW98946.1 hypothetical protein EGJ56_22505 [Pandoraea apista]